MTISDVAAIATELDEIVGGAGELVTAIAVGSPATEDGHDRAWRAW